MYSDTELFIDGRLGPGRLGPHDPRAESATNEEIGRHAHAGTEDLDRALAAAQAGFKAWRKVPAFDRSKLLRRAAENLRSRAT